MRIIRLHAGAWRARLDAGFNDAGVARVAGALGTLWARKNPGATVLVGYDTRPNAARHAELAGAVMAARGLRVVVADAPVPTPAVAWSAARDASCVGVVMLTAGQAPAGWGGLVVRGADGGPASAGFLSNVEQAIGFDTPSARAAVAHADLSAGYAAHLLAQVDAHAIAAAAPCVMANSPHGVVGRVLLPVLRQSGARVLSMPDADDPTCAAPAPGPIRPWVDAASRLVGTTGAACGVIASGDGTRGVVIDEHGNVIDPHAVVSLLLGHVASVAHAGAGRTRVVSTMASSTRIRRKATLLGLETTVVPVGFERLHGEMCEGDVLLASEEYGGVSLPWHLHERDGLLASLLVVELLARGGAPMSAQVRALEREVGHMRYGHRDIALDVVQIQALRNVLPGVNPARVAGMAPVAVSHADGLHMLFDDDSWVMLRPARTQPVVRVYAEAPSMRQRDELLRGATELAVRHV